MSIYLIENANFTAVVAASSYTVAFKVLFEESEGFKIYGRQCLQCEVLGVSEEKVTSEVISSHHLRTTG